MKAVHSDAGFSLVEVVLALAVTAFCLLTLLGLLSLGTLRNASSIDQTTATSLAAAIVSDLRAAPTGATTSVRYGIPIPTEGSATILHTLFLDDTGALSGSVDANASSSNTPAPHYRATLIFTPPATGKTAIPVRILITWPALADATATTTPSKFTGSFDTVIGLDLN